MRFVIIHEIALLFTYQNEDDLLYLDVIDINPQFYHYKFTAEYTTIYICIMPEIFLPMHGQKR